MPVWYIFMHEGNINVMIRKIKHRHNKIQASEVM